MWLICFLLPRHWKSCSNTGSLNATFSLFLMLFSRDQFLAPICSLLACCPLVTSFFAIDTIYIDDNSDLCWHQNYLYSNILYSWYQTLDASYLSKPKSQSYWSSNHWPKIQSIKIVYLFTWYWWGDFFFFFKPSSAVCNLGVIFDSSLSFLNPTLGHWSNDL